MTAEVAPDGVIANHIAAVNSFDIDAIMDPFADDALVNNNHRAFWGTDHIHAWIAKEMVGDHVMLEPVEVVNNVGILAVRCKFDGDYDKTGPPAPLVMTNYIRVGNGNIATRFVAKNDEPEY